MFIRSTSEIGTSIVCDFFDKCKRRDVFACHFVVEYKTTLGNRRCFWLQLHLSNALQCF